MNWKRLLALTLGLSLSLSVAACGDDDDSDPAGPGDTGELTEAEFEGMFDAMAAAGVFTFSPALFTGGAAPSAAAGLPVVTFDESEPCPAGGTVSTSGSADIPDDGSGTITADFTTTHNNCAAQGSNGQTFTFNGTLNYDFSMTFNQSTGALSYNGSNTGSFTWSNGSKSGSCSVNMNIDVSSSGQTVSGSVSGSICGRSVNEDFSDSF